MKLENILLGVLLQHPSTGYDLKKFQDPDFMARLSFAGFMEIDEVIALLDTELDARHAQIARYRFRDRTLPAADTSVPFDQTLAEAVGECLHQGGVRARDLHLAACQ